MMFTLFVILLHVSRHAVAVVVQVYEEMEAVLLPCMYSGSIPEEDPTVIWSRYDLNPKIVHFRREEDDLKGQNQHYSGRTSMKPGALDIGDFSLTLTKPQLTDSGNYTCTISDGRQELRLKDIQLQVKVYQVEVKVEEGAESVILPCKTTAFLPEDITVEWIHSGPELKMVNFYRYGSSHHDKQDKLFCDRTKMNEDLLETGDLSLILKYPTKRDSGNYICTIYRSEDILRQKVVLQHFREQFPPWAKAVLVLLVLFLLVSGGLLFNFWHYFKSVYQVEVDSEREFVKLPCKTIIHLAEDSQIEWSNSKGWKIHMFENSSEPQHWFYRERTEMKKNLLKAGDLSLTLQYPTDSDTDTYTCAAYSSKRNILMKKHVQLHVKVCQIKVKDGEQSIELPFKSSCDLPDDIRVQWWRDEPKPVMMVHVYQNKSDEPEKQHKDYRGRTQMNENLLERGNLSLTLKHPKVRDTGRYRCRVDSRNIWREKTVLLEVKAAEQQIDPAGLEKGRLRRYSGSHEEEIALQSQTV